MSAAYIYGGIDRTTACWTTDKQSATGRAPEPDLHAPAPPRPSGTCAPNDAITYGGLDKTPVRWVSQ